MTIRVAVPIRLARMRVWVDKGNDWSAVDRLVLWALTTKPRTSIDLSHEALVPARLLNGIILRLMRAGWVELAATTNTVAFRATKTGREALEEAETLPIVPRRVSRRLTFAIEPFSLRAFAPHEMRYYRPREIDAIAKDHDVRRVVIKEDWSQLTSGQLHTAAEAILAEVAGDEELSQIDFNASSFPQGFALYTLLGQEIQGLPKDPPSELVRAIKRAAGTKRGATLEVRTSRASTSPSMTGVTIAVPPIDRNDILLTGAEHLAILREALHRARFTFVMHSTFLNCAAFEKLKDEFRAAAQRGAQIEIFWGAARSPEDTQRNLNEAIDINQTIQRDPILRGHARAHMECTKSHAKLLIADTGSPARYIAVVGSCNWLSTGFKRIEASVVLRHPHAVSQCAQDFADLILSAIPVSDVAGDLTKLARSLKKLPAPSGASRIRMVKGDMHGEAIRYARDKASRRIIVGGDRLGLGAEPRTLIPLAAASRRNVEGTIFFSRKSKPLGNADVAALKREAEAAHVRLIEIPDAELHGKFLLWDDDDVLVTSLNWSSADTRRDWPFAEIGIHLSGPNLANDISGRLDQELPDASRPQKRRHKFRRRRG